MVSAISRAKRLVLVALAGFAALAIWLAFAELGTKHEPTGLFTSLPLTWNEAASVGAILQSSEAPHWARRAVAGGATLVPLDTLDEKTLAPLHDLVIAQPRPLAPVENVVLDDWVRRGGRVLLIADPVLTEESIFPFGDPRRPQPTVLLSPILRRWGLELGFGEAQPGGPHVASVMDGPVVVDLPGRFTAIAGGRCSTADGGLMARCMVGGGRIVAFADAQLLARSGASPTQEHALARLRAAAFPTR